MPFGFGNAYRFYGLMCIKNIMLIDAKNKFFLKLFKVKDNALQLDRAIQTVMGKPYIIKAKMLGSAE